VRHRNLGDLPGPQVSHYRLVPVPDPDAPAVRAVVEKAAGCSCGGYAELLGAS